MQQVSEQRSVSWCLQYLFNHDNILQKQDRFYSEYWPIGNRLPILLAPEAEDMQEFTTYIS